MAKLVKYLKDTKAELKKVTWPSKSQIKNNTGISIVFIIIVAVFLFVCDLAFGGLSQAFLNLF